MNDIETSVRVAFGDLVPEAVAESSDWDEVLRRAQLPGPALVERSRRRAWALAFAVLVVLTGAAVNPALGIGERILDFFRGTPAPPAVQREFARINESPPKTIPWSKLGRAEVLAERAHGVMAIETSAGVARLWVAPIASGGTCRYVEVGEQDGFPLGNGVCHPAVPNRPLAAMVNEDLPELVHGRAPVGTAWVDLVLEKADTARLRLVDRYFLAEIPEGKDALAVVARDASGRELGRERLDEWPPPRVAPIFPKQPTEVALAQILEVRLSDGTRARVFASEGPRDRCVRWVFERGSTGDYWDTCGGVPSPDGIYVSGGGDPIVLTGEAGKDVSSVTLQYADGSSAEIPIMRGFFLFEVPRGQTPVRVVGRNSGGRVVAREPVELPHAR